MKILLNYLYNHYKSLAFLCALVFFLMDMSGIVGNWGYMMYYPMIIIATFYNFRHKARLDIKYVLFLAACLVSVIINDIPKYYQTEIRLVVFALLLTAFSGMFKSRKIALFHLHLYHLFTILTLILVIVNYSMFSLGFVSKAAIDIYNDKGLYTGSTANNEMGLLGAVSIMFIVAFCSIYHKLLNFWDKMFFSVALVCSISMMGMASSRMGLMCTLLAVFTVLYKINRKNFIKLTGTIFLVSALVFAASYFLGDSFKFMLEKNGGELEAIDTHSRDEMWEARLKEFYENPLCGIGFASMKYGHGSQMAKSNNGRIETGSGWMTVLSQTGLFGSLCLLLIVMPNLLFIIRMKSASYMAAWSSGMCIMFVLQPITESYITTIGAVLGCLFWINYSVINNLRLGIINEDDLDLERYFHYKLFDKKLVRNE